MKKLVLIALTLALTACYGRASPTTCHAKHIRDGKGGPGAYDRCMATYAREEQIREARRLGLRPSRGETTFAIIGAVASASLAQQQLQLQREQLQLQRQQLQQPHYATAYQPPPPYVRQSYQFSDSRQACNCRGYRGPGGPCYDGPGGPAYAGPGGPAYAGPGGPCYEGPGGPMYSGAGGAMYDGPGGPAYDGPGGPAYSGAGGPCYAGAGGPCYPGVGGDMSQCPYVCKQ